MTINPRTFPEAYKLPSSRAIDPLELQRFLNNLYHAAPEYSKTPRYFLRIFIRTPVYITQLQSLFSNLLNLVQEEQRFNVITVIQRIIENLSNDAYLGGNTTSAAKASYYENYKKLLESIYFQIARDNRNREEKSDFVIELIRNINVCSTGAFSQLNQTLYELTPTTITMASRLGDFRKGIVEAYARELIRRFNIRPGSEVHVVSFCMDIAQESGLNIPGYERIEGYEDQFSIPQLNDVERYKFLSYFMQAYHPDAICKNIRDWYYESLREQRSNAEVPRDKIQNINAILEPFFEHGICDASYVLNCDENTYITTFKPDFLTQVFKDNFLVSVKLLLIVQKVIPCEIPLIQCFNCEIERLQIQVNPDDSAVKNLKETRRILWLGFHSEIPIIKCLIEDIKVLNAQGKTNEDACVKQLIETTVFIWNNYHSGEVPAIIKYLIDEITRLQAQGKANGDYRVKQLMETTILIWRTIHETEKTPEVKKQNIQSHIEDLYLNNKLDKYGFLQKIGIFLLNILMLPVIPGIIKRATTGHFFFSMHGKTQDLINQIHKSPSIIEASLHR